MAAFVVTYELKKLIGESTEPIVYKIEEGAIQRFAQAIGDSNPLYNDIEYAMRSEFGRLMAPPAFTGWPVRGGGEWEILNQFILKLVAAGAPRRRLDGGVEYEFLAPIGAGDILMSITKIADIVGRETKMGPTMVTTTQAKYTNQRGAVALIARRTFLSF